MSGVVALSDLHLGARGSYLTLPGVRERLLHELMEATAGSIDALFLVGDIIDLTVGRCPQAWLAGRQFFEDLADRDLRIGAICYIPGNHDHHLWVQLTEHREILAALDGIRRGESRRVRLDGCHPYWTPLHELFPPSIAESVAFAYPVHWFRDEASRSRLVFHHGHYLDRFITPLVTVAREYHDLHKIESYNLAYMEALFYFCSLDAAVQDKELLLHNKLQRVTAFASAVKNAISVFPKQVRDWFDLNGDVSEPREVWGKERLARLDLVKECVEQDAGPAHGRDIWVMGHSHRRGTTASGTAPVQLYDLGGWVLNHDPEFGQDDAWSEPAILYWSRDKGAKLQNMDLSAEERAELLSHVRGFGRTPGKE